MSNGKSQTQDDSGGVPEWVVTFGDMMSLLLTFFIMLFSMSEIKENERFQATVESLRKTFGYEASLASILPGDFSSQNSDFQTVSSLARTKRDNLMSGKAREDAPVGDAERVTSLRQKSDPLVAGMVPFEEGNDRLTEKDETILNEIYGRIAGIPQRIEIVGHTTNHPLPAGAPIGDHWDLAYTRARKVKDYLVKRGIKSKRIRIAVAAGNELKYRGIDPIEQKKNPRVEIKLLSETIKNASPKEGG